MPGFSDEAKTISSILLFAQRNEAEAHAVEGDDYRLQGLGQIFSRPGGLDADAVEVLQGVKKGLVAPAFHRAAIFDVIGGHAHHVETGARQGVGVLRAADQLVGVQTAGVLHLVAQGGVEGTDGQVRLGDDLPHLFIRVIRVAVDVQGSLDAARRDDHTGEQQGGHRLGAGGDARPWGSKPAERSVGRWLGWTDGRGCFLHFGGG